MRSPSAWPLAGICILLMAAPRPGTAAPPDAPAGRPAGGENVPRLDAWDDAEAAGLPPGSRPVVLTWERAYTLALVRARSPQPIGLAESLDPRTLAEQAARFGTRNFARFRRDFLAGPEAAVAGFRDPSGAVLDLLRRLQAVEGAKRDVAAWEALNATYRRLVAGGSSGLSQFDLDRAAVAEGRARRRLEDALRRYRDRLDEVKVDLGLSPHTAVVPDRTILAAFREVFVAADLWGLDPKRELDELPRLVGRLPRLADATLDSLAGPEAAAGGARRLGEALDAAERTAVKNRGAGPDIDGSLGLRVRRRVRHLLAIRQDYAEERRTLVLALRMKDIAFEEVLEPAKDDPPCLSRSGSAAEVIRRAGEVAGIENRIVDLWATFQEERLGLARDLSNLPYADWKSFLGTLVPQRGDAGHVRQASPPVPPAPPAQPAPPAPPAPVARPPGVARP